MVFFYLSGEREREREIHFAHFPICISIFCVCLCVMQSESILVKPQQPKSNWIELTKEKTPQQKSNTIYFINIMKLWYDAMVEWMEQCEIKKVTTISVSVYIEHCDAKQSFSVVKCSTRKMFIAINICICFNHFWLQNTSNVDGYGERRNESKGKKAVILTLILPLHMMQNLLWFFFLLFYWSHADRWFSLWF